jgi:TRAP-type mannitol/chloroaromatic compound transport system permease small subunit
MASASAHMNIPRYGKPAPIARLVGWITLYVLAAFMINNALVVGFDFPGLRAIGQEGAGLAWVSGALFAGAVALAAAKVLMSRDRNLRFEAMQVHRFNVYLVRSLFWAVLLVGLADVTIAFLRVEGLFEGLVSDEAVRGFGKSAWVGLRFHLPLIAAGFVLALFTRTLGFHWLALMIVVAELAIVISRFVFSYEQALMGDLVRYWYAALFLFASAYTLFEEGHVRVDVLYAGMGERARGKVNTVGTMLLGMTTMWVLIAIGFNGKQSVINSPVMNFEISQSGAVGMFIKYQMAAFIGIFAITMLIQFVSYFFEAVANARGEPGARKLDTVSAH